ncbi:MAG: hypothetical protein HQL96_14800 [Magnetococcales bacterium]|nr:hypothetical protein [Magnetococcales bacterium]
MFVFPARKSFCLGEWDPDCREILEITKEATQGESIDTTWLKQLHIPAESEVKARELMPIIDGLGKLMAAGFHDTINAIFRSTSPDTAHPAILMSLLRTTFMIRDRLQEWHPFLRKVRAALQQRGCDAPGILAGLL